METTFITIHDLSREGLVKCASQGVEDVLGYHPADLKGKSVWEYLHPGEIPFAKTVHRRGIQKDKAAVLSYFQVRHKQGHWICCETVFTIVYDVMVACTSSYAEGSRSHKRAIDAPVVRRLFSSSPRDPRYHMLSYISSKFSQLPKTISHEPRAALFLNRFTRTSSIMFATNGVAAILGVTPQQLVSKSFYYCIDERCLRDAVRCIETAKANDSIAYLRFWYRNPLLGDGDSDVEMMDSDSADEDEEDEDDYDDESDDDESDTMSGNRSIISSGSDIARSNSNSSGRSLEVTGKYSGESPSSRRHPMHRSTQGRNADRHPLPDLSSQGVTGRPTSEDGEPPIEIEAVVSCSSDVLLVVLRRARPPIPQSVPHDGHPVYANTLLTPPPSINPTVPQDSSYGYSQSGLNSSSASTPSGGPEPQEFMETVRDVAELTGGIIGMNGSLETLGRGSPGGGSS
ncbi:hypothetical protein FQN54_008848 [Arachnomyces sp. PD_36]|nr:hypothetical protein FQN54_008848 [Arachnomyces sp. PD_36]